MTSLRILLGQTFETFAAPQHKSLQFPNIEMFSVPYDSRRAGRKRQGGIYQQKGPAARAAGPSRRRFRSPSSGQLILDAATVGLGRRRIGALAGLLGGQAARDVIHALGLRLAARRIVVDRAVVGDLAILVDDEHVRRGLGLIGVADGARLIVQNRVVDAVLLIPGRVLGRLQEL